MTTVRPVYEKTTTPPWQCTRCGGARASLLHKLCMRERKRRDEHPDADDVAAQLQQETVFVARLLGWYDDDPSRLWTSVLVGVCVAMVVLAALGAFR